MRLEDCGGKKISPHSREEAEEGKRRPGKVGPRPFAHLHFPRAVVGRSKQRGEDERKMGSEAGSS